jgi:hypothetical protein
MKWKRVAGYGLALWFVPFAISFFLFPVREGDRALFESLITVVGVASAVTGAVLYFRDVGKSDMKAGLLLGLIWAAISIVIDLPIFLWIFDMPLRNYVVDIALTYLAFPAITTGIAAAKSPPRALS